VTIAADSDGRQRTRADHSQQLVAEIRKHERLRKFPDTEEVTGSNPVRPTMDAAQMRPSTVNGRRRIHTGLAIRFVACWYEMIAATAETAI
jgi:hypothetical protein